VNEWCYGCFTVLVFYWVSKFIRQRAQVSDFGQARDIFLRCCLLHKWNWQCWTCAQCCQVVRMHVVLMAVKIQVKVIRMSYHNATLCHNPEDLNLDHSLLLLGPLAWQTASHLSYSVMLTSHPASPRLILASSSHPCLDLWSNLFLQALCASFNLFVIFRFYQ